MAFVSPASSQMQQAAQCKPDRTQYATKYGVSKEPWLERLGKSGLSPIRLGFLKDYPTVESFSLDSKTIRYQQWVLRLFTSQILLSWGATESADARPSDLTWIHPLYSRDKWLKGLPAHMPPIPLGHGTQGEYTAWNPIVWKALVPVLALASQFISNSHLWAWWDGLLFSEREVIEQEKCPPGYWGTLFRFRRRPAHMWRDQNARNRNMQKFMELAGSMKLAIFSGNSSVITGMPDGEVWQGITKYEQSELQPTLYISYEEISSLIFGELTTSERLIQQFQLAVTIVHETAHAIYARRAKELNFPSKSTEPYFEDESIAELGASLINTLVGGEPCSVTSNLAEGWDFRESPMMALVLEKNFPNVFNVCEATENTPCLDPDLAGHVGTVLRVPIPVSYISDVQQESFWDNYFSVYGISALRQIPQRKALRMDVSPNAFIQYFTDLECLAPAGDDSHQTGTLPDTKAQAAQTLRDAEFEDRVLRIDRDINMLNDWTLLQYHPKYRKAIKGLAPFQQAAEWDKKFDPLMPTPLGFARVLSFLLSHWQQLGLATMVHWTAANTFLGYIRNVGQQRPLDRDEYYEFLTFCQCRGILFEFRRFGTGLVRRVDAGWPKPLIRDSYSIPTISDPPSPKEELVEEIMFAHSRGIFQLGYGRDYACSLFIKWWEGCLRAWNKWLVLMGQEEDEVTMAEINEVIKSFTRKRKLIVFGPPGVVRRLDRGWPEGLMEGLDPDYPPSAFEPVPDSQPAVRAEEGEENEEWNENETIEEWLMRQRSQYGGGEGGKGEGRKTDG